MDLLGDMNDFYYLQQRGYLTGNVSGGAVTTGAFPCGLDCSGFVSAAYNIDYKLQSWDLQHLGVLVENINDMKKMDLIVSAGVHCLLFDSYNPSTGIVSVYDCTIRRFINEGEIGKCSLRQIPYDKILNFQFRTPWHECVYTYSNNGNTHTKICSICGKTITESHHTSTINDYYHETQCSCGATCSPQHEFVYTYYATSGHRKSCSLCDYSLAENHVYNASYTSNGKSGHTASCLCGASKTEAHNPEGQYRYDASMHYIHCADCGQVVFSGAHTIRNYICTVCGYNSFSFTENGKIYFGNDVSSEDLAAILAELNEVS